ncbi:unnamed protein product [Haemonchus placei]|uniref:Phosphotransferase n=1 Tax=Haemonchus placei TaxID=6290 RepID=A0A158QPE6_HAEPC|nr:unnamed protein product [Haemonchus placei]
MARFMEEQGIPFSRKLPLGFTFSFPCQQEGLTRDFSAKLIRWTKGFKASGCEGVDVCKMLKDACNRRSESYTIPLVQDIEIDVVALLNDTVGTLMACAFKENTCQASPIGVDVEDSFFISDSDDVSQWKSIILFQMIMNTEWGAFGDDGALRFIHTKYDREVDKSSVNPGKQIFEKMISGMYLGELARVALKEMAQQGLLFGGQTGLLEERGRFSTRFMSDIGSDQDLYSDLAGDEEKKTFQNTEKILGELGFNKITRADCANVAYVCNIITTRAAHLLAAGIATLINRVERPLVTVGIDGSVYRFHPVFPQLLDDKIAELIDENLRYKLMLSEDGSGIGAAVVAAVANRIQSDRTDQKEEEPQQENQNEND